MTPKDAFKVGFLHKCAADGLSSEEVLERIRNAKLLHKMGANTALGSITSKAWNTLWPLMLLGPPAAGVAGGYALASAQDDTYDKDELRKKEEIAEYHRAVARLQRVHDKQQAGAV